MSSRHEVLIRILALLITKEDVNWNKKPHIKMLKMALFDCAINEKFCSVHGGRGICLLFSSPPQRIWQLTSPHHREIAIQNKKNASLRSKRFQSSYCTKVREEAKKRLKGEGKGRRGNACPQTPQFWKTPLDISPFVSFVNWQLVKIEV